MLYNKKIFEEIPLIRWLITIAIILILFLQIYSLYAVYIDISNIIKTNISQAFIGTMKEYRNIEFNKLHKPLEFKIESEDYLIKKGEKLDYDYTNSQLNIDEIMTKVIGIVIDDANIKINLNEIDSLFSANLKKNSIEIPYQLTATTIKNDSILLQTKNTPEVNFNYQTPKIEFDINREIQASYGGLYKVIFGKIIWYLITSLIIIIFISILLVYQLKIILRQKKIEQIRQNFVDSMTHELKHPLQGALSLSEILENPSFSDNPELRKNAIQKIKHNLYNLNQSLESILERSYSEKLQHSARWERGNIKEIIEEIMADFILENSKIHFSTEFNIPQFFYYFDKMHLSNAIKNLIDNAVKYSQKEIDIYISVREGNQQLLISVADKGIGIREGNLKSIFDKFYRVENQNYGFGLGLSYVKWVAELHKGNITVESTYGKGSVFTLSIPIIENPSKR